MSFHAVTGSALLLAWVSFLAFLFFTAKQLKASKEAGATVKSAIADIPANKSLADLDISKLLENAAKLVDSLAKAGPGLSALGASILFLAIAAYNVNKTEASSNPKPAATETAKPGTSGK